MRCSEGVGLGAHLQKPVFRVVLYDIPEGFIIIAVAVIDVSVQSGSNLYFRASAERFRKHLKMRQSALDNAEKATEGQLHPCIRHAQHKASGQKPAAKVQFERKIFRLLRCKVDFLSVDAHTDGSKIDGIDDLSEILWVAVFPPADARFIREPDTRDVRALMVVSRIPLLKISAHPHIAVAEGGQTFHEPQMFAFQMICSQFPRIDVKYPVIHCFLL